MNTVAEPARHGKTRAYLVINDDVYTFRFLTRGKLRLKKNGGERAGAIYFVGRFGGELICSCPDALHHPGLVCKHVGAVLANRLLPRPKAGKAVSHA